MATIQCVRCKHEGRVAMLKRVAEEAVERGRPKFICTKCGERGVVVEAQWERDVRGTGFGCATNDDGAGTDRDSDPWYMAKLEGDTPFSDYADMLFIPDEFDPNE